MKPGRGSRFEYSWFKLWLLRWLSRQSGNANRFLDWLMQDCQILETTKLSFKMLLLSLYLVAREMCHETKDEMGLSRALPSISYERQ